MDIHVVVYWCTGVLGIDSIMLLQIGKASILVNTL